MAPIAVAQTGRDQTNPGLEASLGPPLLEWALQHDPEDILMLANPLGPGHAAHHRQIAGDQRRVRIAGRGLSRTRGHPTRVTSS